MNPESIPINDVEDDVVEQGLHWLGGHEADPPPVVLEEEDDQPGGDGQHGHTEGALAERHQDAPDEGEAEGGDRSEDELGPGTALSGFMKRIDKNVQMLNIADVASLEATVKALQS